MTKVGTLKKKRRRKNKGKITVLFIYLFIDFKAFMQGIDTNGAEICCSSTQSAGLIDFRLV